MDNVSPMQHLTQATKKYPNMSSWVGTFLKAKGEPGGAKLAELVVSSNGGMGSHNPDASS